MRKGFVLILFALFFMGLQSCDPSKKYIKEGEAARQLGKHDAAANYYYNALLLKPNNTIALTGLKESGDQVLQGKFLTFGKYVVSNSQEEAVMQYLSCKKYFDKCKKVGVTLEWQNMYSEVYEDIKNEYISLKYEEGLQLMQENKYEKAEAVFSKIAEVDSAYKDATVLRLKSIAEPLYQRGSRSLEVGNYKEALSDFDKIISLDPNYKNSKLLRAETIRKGTLGLGVLPVQNQTKMVGFEQKLYQQLIATLVKNKNPFLKVIERSSLENLLREQDLGMSGIIDPESAAKAGKLIGLRYVLMTAISDLAFEEVGPKTDSLVAYEAFSETIKLPNTNLPQTVTRFKKVNYADTYHKRRVYYRVFYQLVSTETAQVVTSDVLSEEMLDEYHLSYFNGNVNALYPELPKNNQLPPKPDAFRAQFNQVKKSLISSEAMNHEVCKTIAEKLNTDILIYIEK
jgi:tetratricopeptide (TPR) repeat protein